MNEPITVLIIDDGAEDRESYISLLKKIPDSTYRYMEACDGKSGLELIISRAFDCILLDYSLPGMGGLDVLRSIRTFNQYIPVIMLTGQGNESVAAESIKEGAHDYLIKSNLSSEKLHEVIKAAITQANLRRNIADIKYQMHQTTMELAQSEERYDLAVQGMSVGLWDWNIETNELYWSKRFRDIVGVNASDFIPHYDEFANRLHPDDKEAVLKALFGHIENHTPYNVEYRLRCNDGNYVWIHACGQAKWNSQGKAVRMVGSVNNISDRKNLEIERKKLISELTDSNSELERFAYICSHDLQEPLRMISSFTELLQQHLADNVDEKVNHYMCYITDGAKRARQLINDVLNYAQVGYESELLSNVESEVVLGNVLYDLHTRIEETSAIITHGRLPAVHMQATHLRQLLQNLIGNALKFCKSRPKIHINAEVRGEYFCFSVSDNGIGIAPEHIQKIFVIFERLHNNEHYSGTGIGLALCKKIVQKYGGELWVESEPEKGSSFFFTLPKGIANQEIASAE